MTEQPSRRRRGFAFSSDEEKNRILSNPYIPIQVMPLMTTTGNEVSRRAVIIDPDSEHLEAGIVSSEYHLVPNEYVRDTVEQIIATSELKATLQSDNTIWDGKHFRLRYVFDDVEAEVRSQHPMDFIRLSLDAWNSYDGSAKFGIAFNVFRLVCLNGMITSSMLGGFSFKHVENGEVQKQIDRAVQRIIALANNNAIFAVAERFSKFAALPMEMERGVPMLQRLGFGDLQLVTAIESVIGDIAETEEKKATRPTAWDWYNGATRALTMSNTFSTEKKGREVTDAFFEVIGA